jgi:adenine phosphoribosyltransferase
MHGAIQLVEQQQGKVAGIVSIVIEDCERTQAYRETYKCVSAILPGTEWQRQANSQVLESFKTYNPQDAFPTSRFS